MQRVFLGKTGIEVSKLCLGTGTVGGNHTSRQTRSLGLKGLADLIVYAYEKGITFIDTADAYGPNVSEELICEALHPYPEDLVIATKGGLTRTGPGIMAYRPPVDPDREGLRCGAGQIQ